MLDVLYIALLSYICGSIPSGLILGLVLNKGDIRNSGSGNIGATNAVRVGGKFFGLLVFILDFLKAFIPTSIVAYYYKDSFYTSISALSIIGHIFPIWLKFKGGKGVATSFGYIAAINFYIFLLTLSIWVAIFLKTRISSIASLLSIISPVIISLFYEDMYIFTSCISIAALVYCKHISNIMRLTSGKEWRF
ncbi:Glycerol-3-phosphate acyltransferase [Candidatus Cyrtobacter comes]|uniref:Glycerol-3-phosphate acyltransferase n=1 Tax=Candidatus Cyrtobacter comes TaxID=675776 RepID=A0ABU5L6R9_9RICK|nr:glycerol-3-phosphate 1-O-acyltransferase PlsY [Candidatus Cyrtobacter comes]MDZ5761819.1 Glycerol-3-phosphate acyltransferase [Candidatus Cyrtobacter comes]